MDITEITLEITDVLCRRRSVVASLLEESQDKRSLTERVDLPRSTLDRAVRELEAIDLVTYTEGEYSVTPLGKQLADDFFAFLERVELALEFEPFLQHIPIEEFDLDLRALAGAELLVPEEGNPLAMIDRHVQRLAEMNRVRGMLPVIGLHGHETAHERIVEDGAEAELIVEPDVAEVMVTDPSFRELTEEMIATDRFELYVYDGAIPYFLGVFDEEIVQIGVDEDGNPRALVEAHRQKVRSWAYDTINGYKRQAELYDCTRSQDGSLELSKVEEPS